ncbi:MAG: TrkH family potassium uptake protein [Candidatus Bathyanammoxibius sp.]
MSLSTKFLKAIGKRPGVVISGSFLIIIFIGAGFLSLPQATASGERIPFLDAIFTSTSATCVTGLIVRDTGQYFSTFGQVIILILIQVGGLGIMTLAAFFGAMVIGRLSVSQHAAVKDVLDVTSVKDVRRLLLFIVVVTLSLEALGFFMLLPVWLGNTESLWTAIYYSLFHSVSAYCNAGFCLFSDSLVNYRDNTLLNLTITSLIILGGLGFYVLANIYYSFKSLFKAEREASITLHTQLVLFTTVILIAVGALLFYLFERDHSIAGLGLLEQVKVCYFQSVTARTCGFHTVDVVRYAPPTLFLFMILMFIGGSPGGTAGGIKTTAVLLWVAGTYNTLKGRDDIALLGRTIPRQVVRRAFAILICSFTVILISSIILLSTEKGGFEQIVFEVFSAFGTVGLSTGITSELNPLGKIVLTVLMFVGRLGPLTLALILVKERVSRISYPEEKIVVG